MTSFNTLIGLSTTDPQRVLHHECGCTSEQVAYAAAGVARGEARWTTIGGDHCESYRDIIVGFRAMKVRDADWRTDFLHALRGHRNPATVIASYEQDNFSLFARGLR